MYNNENIKRWENLIKKKSNYIFLFGLLSTLLWFVTNLLSIFLHEFSHGITAVFLGGNWDALYINPIQGFVYTRLTDDFHKFLVTIVGTGSILFFGIIIYFLQKNKVKSIFWKLFLSSSIFFAATEPLGYWGLNSMLYLIDDSGSYGDLGNLMELISNSVEIEYFTIGIAIIIIIISSIVLIILFPKYFQTIYEVLFEGLDHDKLNFKSSLILFFIPYQFLIGLFVVLILEDGDLFYVIVRLFYGLILANIGNNLVMRRKKKKDKSNKSRKNDLGIYTSNLISSEGNHRKFEEKYNKSLSILSKKNFLTLGMMTVILSSIWLGIFGYSEENATGLNWNEVPYMSNIEISFNDEDTIYVVYKFHPNFPSQNLHEFVFNWDNYISTALNFSKFLIKEDYSPENSFSTEIDITNDFWASEKYFTNSRTILTGNIQFSEIQNLTVDSDILTYNITDPWMVNNNGSFIDAFKIEYSNKYEFISLDFYKNNQLMNISLYSNITSQFIIHNPSAENSPLIYQLKLRLV